MATLDKTANSGRIHYGGLHQIANTIDLAAVATGDVVQMLDIPAGTKVYSVSVKVITACGLTATATVGDGSGANSWDASTNLNATAGTITTSVGGTDAYATAGKLYSTADTIDMTCTITSGPIVAGEIRVWALCEAAI